MKTSSPTRVTITQVAKLSGVAPSTASHILNKRPDCYASEETRQRVEEAARTLGYRPNFAARVLRGGRTSTLGFITPTLEVEVTSAKCVAFEERARAAGYLTMISFSPGDPQTEDRVLQALRDRNVDGIVLYPTAVGPHTQLEALIAAGFSLVTLGGAELNLPADDISIDYGHGGHLQAQHLLSLGRKRICFLSIDFGKPFKTVEDRYAGLRQSLATAGIGLQRQAWPTHMPRSIQVPDTYVHELTEFLRTNGRHIDALVGSNDNIAVAAAEAAHAAGFRVPTDIAIIGYDDASIGRSSAPALTTIAHDSVAMAATAFDFLHERMRGSKDAPRRQVVPPHLIIRGSTRAG